MLVELFTSEGCSSCPPADALLAQLQKQQPAGAQVVALEEHVTYWNHDGWTDPYSADEWTQRQLGYAILTPRSDVYTPEMVIDGETAFAGNVASTAEQAIENAAQQPATGVSIVGEKPANHSQKVSVSVAKLVGNSKDDVAEVWVAVAEDGLSSSVTRGENSGHTLDHTAVLRSLHKIGVAEAKRGDTTFSGQTEIRFNPHWNGDKLHVIAFVQEKKSRKILGAASLVD